MINEAEPAPRVAHCAGCGERFFCNPTGNCWCKSVAPVHPVPAPEAACFCPNCLAEQAP